jgi:hypothetical protein
VLARAGACDELSLDPLALLLPKGILDAKITIIAFKFELDPMNQSELSIIIHFLNEERVLLYCTSDWRKFRIVHPIGNCFL